MGGCPGLQNNLDVWKSGSFTVLQSGSLAAVVRGIDGIERSSVAVVELWSVVLMEFEEAVVQQWLSHADAQGGRHFNRSRTFCHANSVQIGPRFHQTLRLVCI